MEQTGMDGKIESEHQTENETNTIGIQKKKKSGSSPDRDLWEKIN